jgi:hypothetical protein
MIAHHSVSDHHCRDIWPYLIPFCTAALSECIKYALVALAQGITTISIKPHLDQWPSGICRNNLVFDHLQAYGGSSYYSNMLQPLGRIIRLLGTHQ